MVPVLAGSPELFPNVLTNLLRSLQVNFHVVRIRSGPDRVNPNVKPNAEALACSEETVGTSAPSTS
jgi:phosphomannomutase